MTQSMAGVARQCSAKAHSRWPEEMCVTSCMAWRVQMGTRALLQYAVSIFCRQASCAMMSALSFSFSGGVLFGDILNPTGMRYVRRQTLALHMQTAAHPVLPA